MLALSQAANCLLRDGASFDPWSLAWQPGAAPAPDAREIEPLKAVAWLYAQPGVRRVPVGVIGPNQASSRQLETAEWLGRRLGELGLSILCGGRAGVMEAASRGNLAAGGLPIGLLPGDDWREANPYVAIPLASGIGEARNAVIARAAAALIAIGGEHGTLTEMAFGRRFNRLVLALEDAPEVPGVLRCADVEAALERLAQHLLGLDCEA